MKYKAFIRIDLEVEFEDNLTDDLKDQAIEAAQDLVGYDENIGGMEIIGSPEPILL